eukprot:scaffold141582_cov19-Tisochrysis_lutea.AAC.1
MQDWGARHYAAAAAACLRLLENLCLKAWSGRAWGRASWAGAAGWLCLKFCTLCSYHAIAVRHVHAHMLASWPETARWQGL